jgi:hypothetical protein
MYYTEYTEGSKREGYHVNGNPQICRSSQATNPSSFEDDRPLTYIAEQSGGVAMPISDEVSGHKTCSFASAPTSCILVSAPNALHATVASPIYHANAFGIVSADPACQQGYGGRSPSVETSGHKRLSTSQGKPDGRMNRDSSSYLAAQPNTCESILVHPLTLNPSNLQSQVTDPVDLTSQVNLAAVEGPRKKKTISIQLLPSRHAPRHKAKPLFQHDCGK